MRIERVGVGHDATGAELTATVDGFRLWYRLPAALEPAARGDAFVVAALPAAMAAAEPLQVDAPVSPLLLRGMERAQEILHAWNPALRKIEVDAPAVPAERLERGVACFYSGGIDSGYSLLKNAADITHLLFIGGFDFHADHDALFHEVRARIQEVATAFGKALVPVLTNVRNFYDARRLGASLYHGPMLASVALAAGFPRTLLPATFTYAELFPWGSHPLLDPLWSTEGVSIVHDGAEASRTGKLQVVATCPELLRVLRVCLQGEVYNCGVCAKCLRTRLGLRLVGATAGTLSPLESVSAVSRMPIWDERELAFVQDNYAMSLSVGDREVARALRSCLRRYAIRKGVQELDGLLFGNRLRDAWRVLRRRGTGSKPGGPRVEVRG